MTTWLIVGGVALNVALCFLPVPVEADEDAAAAAAPDAVEGNVGGWVVTGGAKLCRWDKHPHAFFLAAPDSPPTELRVVPAPLLHHGRRMGARGFHALSITNYGAARG